MTETRKMINELEKQIEELDAEKALVMLDSYSTNAFFTTSAVLMYHSRLINERLNALAASCAALSSAFDIYRKRVIWAVNYEERVERRRRMSTWKKRNLIEERWRHKHLES